MPTLRVNVIRASDLIAADLGGLYILHYFPKFLLNCDFFFFFVRF